MNLYFNLEQQMDGFIDHSFETKAMHPGLCHHYTAQFMDGLAHQLPPIHFHCSICDTFFKCEQCHAEAAANAELPFQQRHFLFDFVDSDGSSAFSSDKQDLSYSADDRVFLKKAGEIEREKINIVDAEEEEEREEEEVKETKKASEEKPMKKTMKKNDKKKVTKKNDDEVLVKKVEIEEIIEQKEDVKVKKKKKESDEPRRIVLMRERQKEAKKEEKKKEQSKPSLPQAPLINLTGKLLDLVSKEKSKVTQIQMILRTYEFAIALKKSSEQAATDGSLVSAALDKVCSDFAVEADEEESQSDEVGQCCRILSLALGNAANKKVNEMKSFKEKENNGPRHLESIGFTSASESRKAAGPLLAWYNEHSSHPYPSIQEKDQLQMKTGLSFEQISTWFSNRRNRLSKKNTKVVKP